MHTQVKELKQKMQGHELFSFNLFCVLTKMSKIKAKKYITQMIKL